jgi:hypothetical protein
MLLQIEDIIEQAEAINENEDVEAHDSIAPDDLKETPSESEQTPNFEPSIARSLSPQTSSAVPTERYFQTEETITNDNLLTSAETFLNKVEDPVTVKDPTTGLENSEILKFIVDIEQEVQDSQLEQEFYDLINEDRIKEIQKEKTEVLEQKWGGVDQGMLWKGVGAGLVLLVLRGVIVRYMK